MRLVMCLVCLNICLMCYRITTLQLRIYLFLDISPLSGQYFKTYFFSIFFRCFSKLFFPFCMCYTSLANQLINLFLQKDNSFRTPWLSIIRVMTMLLGEIGYFEHFLLALVDKDPSTIHFPNMTLVLLNVFILLVPILLINLLIGLAVGDIAAIRENAVLQRLAMQVKQIYVTGAVSDCKSVFNLYSSLHH